MKNSQNLSYDPFDDLGGEFNDLGDEFNDLDSLEDWSYLVETTDQQSTTTIETLKTDDFSDLDSLEDCFYFSGTIDQQSITTTEISLKISDDQLEQHINQHKLLISQAITLKKICSFYQRQLSKSTNILMQQQLELTEENLDIPFIRQELQSTTMRFNEISLQEKSLGKQLWQLRDSNELVMLYFFPINQNDRKRKHCQFDNLSKQQKTSLLKRDVELNELKKLQEVDSFTKEEIKKTDDVLQEYTMLITAQKPPASHLNIDLPSLQEQMKEDLGLSALQIQEITIGTKINELQFNLNKENEAIETQIKNIESQNKLSAAQRKQLNQLKQLQAAINIDKDENSSITYGSTGSSEESHQSSASSSISKTSSHQNHIAAHELGSTQYKGIFLPITSKDTYKDASFLVTFDTLYEWVSFLPIFLQNIILSSTVMQSLQETLQHNYYVYFYKTGSSYESNSVNNSPHPEDVAEVNFDLAIVTLGQSSHLVDRDLVYNDGALNGMLF